MPTEHMLDQTHAAVVVSYLRGWVLIGDKALAPGDPCLAHVLSEGY